MRVGELATNEPVGSQPATSATRCPPDCVNRLTLPSAPRGTVTRVDTVAPAPSTLRLDALGRASPDGQAVTNPLPADSVMTTFIVTAATPEVGTPPRPATFSEIVAPCPGLAPVYPICNGPGRVSRIRSFELTGPTGTGATPGPRWMPSSGAFPEW